jgi:hypothetical protein
MKCKIFVGRRYEVQDLFNAWAKGKALTKDVIIHTIHTNVIYHEGETQIAIIVYHPEDPQWDTTPPKPAVPVHEVLINGVKVKNVQVTQ